MKQSKWIGYTLNKSGVAEGFWFDARPEIAR